MAGPPRRRPFPYDMVVAGQGVMLGHKTQPNDGDGPTPLVGTKVQPFTNAAPTSYEYDLEPPTYERVQPYNDLTLGFGLRKQGSYQDKKYRYAQGVDCTIAGLQIKGPHIVTYTPATTDATNGGMRGKFFALTVATVLTQFAAVGRYILKRVNDTSWTVVKDWGAGIYALDVQIFASSDTGTVLAWIALSGAQAAWSADGTTWTVADGTAGKPNQTNLAYCQVGNEFWRASDINQCSKCDINADPTVAGNWTNANSFRIGDKTSAIVSMVVTANGTLLILKGDGIYTLDDAGDDHQLFASVAEGVGDDNENARYVGAFGDSTHVTYGHQHLRIAATMAYGLPHLDLDEIGPEKFTENDSPVKGRITAFCGNGAMGAYAAIYDDDTSTSYLLKFSAWLTPVLSGGTLEEAKRIDAWHGAIDAPTALGAARFAGKKITQMTRSSVGATAGHYRIYGGCDDGSLFWFQLPCVPNPAACSAYLFTTLDSYLYLPYWTGTFEADLKQLRSASVFSTLLSATNSLRVEYKTDPTIAAYVPIGVTFTRPIRQREEFPNNTGVYLADLRAVFISTATTSTPQVTSIAFRFSVRPLLQLTYEFRVLIADGLVRRNGTPYKTIGAEQIRTLIRAAASAIGSVDVVLPDQSTQALTFVDYKEGLSWDARLRKWSGSLDCVAIQYSFATTYGTWQRVGQYHWSDLAPYTWSQVAGL